MTPNSKIVLAKRLAEELVKDKDQLGAQAGRTSGGPAGGTTLGEGCCIRLDPEIGTGKKQKALEVPDPNYKIGDFRPAKHHPMT